MSDGICLDSLQKEKTNILKNIEGGKQSKLLEMPPPVTVDIITRMSFDDINERNEYGITALQMAAIENRADVIKSLLEVTGIEINKISSSKTNRNTALHYAAKYGSMEALEALLENSEIDVRVLNSSNKSPSHLLSEYRRANLSAEDLEKSTIMSRCENDWMNQDLHNAILSKKIKIEKITVMGFKHISTRNRNALTPFHLAAIKNLPEVIKIMLPEVKPDIYELSSCTHELTALQYAATFGNFEVIDVFRDHIASREESERLKSDVKTYMEPRAKISCLNAMNICDSAGFERRVTFLKELKLNDPDLNSILNNPLELALFKNRMDLAKVYYNISIKPYIGMLSDTLKLPCIWSDFEVGEMYFESARENDMEAIALHSMANGADGSSATILQLINAFCHCEETETSKHEQHLRVLNERLNMLYKRSDFGETLVEKYLLKGNIEIANALLLKGVIKPEMDMLFEILKQPEESLGKSDGIFFEKAFDLLLQNGCENVKGKRNGLPLLHSAIVNNRMQALLFLLSRRVDVNQRAPDEVEGDTALHLAVIHENLDAVKLLIEYGADEDMEVNSVKPFQLAVKKSMERAIHCEIVTYLFKAKMEKKNENAEDMLVIIRGEHEYENYKVLMKAALKVYFMGNKNVRRTRSHVLDDMLYKYFENQDYELIEHFLQAGFRPKRAALRHLMKHSVDEPHKIEEIKSVYWLIVKYANSICRKQSERIRLPTADADMKKLTIIELMNEKFELDEDDETNEYTVMEYACKIQAGEMIEEILNTEDVFKSMKDGQLVYLVTNLVPKTCRIERKSNNSSQLENTPSSEHIVLNRFGFDAEEHYVSDDDEDDDIDDVKNELKEDYETVSHLSSPSRESFLQLLIDSSSSEETDTRMAKLLNREPFRSLTQVYFKQYRRFELLLLILHVLFMSLFTKYITPTNVSWQSNSANASLFQNSCVSINLLDLHLRHTDSAMQVFCFVIWFFWPIFLVGLGLLESVHLFSNCKSDSGIISVWRRLSDWAWKIEIRLSRQRWIKFKLGRKYCLEKLKIFDFIFTLIRNALMEHFPTIFSSLFAFLVITWLAIYFGLISISSDVFCIITESIIVVGWINTLNYLSVLSTSINNLLIMLQRIFAKEFPAFLTVYVFFYLGFGFTYHMVNQSQSDYDEGYRSDSIFPTMFGIENFAQDIIPVLNNESGKSNLEKGFIYVYIGITFLVLSNLLIAMINQSYTEINQVSDLHMQNLRLQLIRQKLWLSKIRQKLWLGLSKIFPKLVRENSFDGPRFITFGKKIVHKCDIMQYHLIFERIDREMNKSDISNTDILKLYIDNTNLKIIQQFNQVDARLNALQGMQEMILDKLKKADAKKKWKATMNAFLNIGNNQ